MKLKILIITILLIGLTACSAVALEPAETVIEGVVNLQNGYIEYDFSGFNFDDEKIVPWSSTDADILFGDFSLFVPYYAEPYLDTVDEPQGGILLMEEVFSTSGVETCPTEGYGYHWTFGVDDAVYCVRTRDGGHYAVIQIERMDESGIYLRYRYQPSGAPDFGAGEESVIVSTSVEGDE